MPDKDKNKKQSLNPSPKKKSICLGGEVDVDVELRPADGTYKAPHSSLKKKTKMEKKAPRPKCASIPNLYKPLPCAIMVLEQADKMKIQYHNSTHGLHRMAGKLRKNPLKGTRYVFGRKIAPCPTPHTSRDKKALGLFDK